MRPKLLISVIAGIVGMFFFVLLPQTTMSGGSTTSCPTPTSTSPLVVEYEYSTSGICPFTVPDYLTLTVRVWGAGGGGGGGGIDSFTRAGTGGQSIFNSATPLVANGGRGGMGNRGGGQGGTGGTASGGDTNATGQNGEGAFSNGWSGKGGDGADPDGGSGGARLTSAGTGRSGQEPGGGGSGGNINPSVFVPSNGGGGGGGGGRAEKTWNVGDPGAPVPGEVIQIQVGNGGSAGSGYNNGGGGGDGEVHIIWTENTTPTCTLELSPSTINQGGSATLSWSSQDTVTFTITNVGPADVPPGEGYTTVSPSATTVYEGTVESPDGTGTCTATLTVNPATTADLVGNSEADDTIIISEGEDVDFTWSATNASAGCSVVASPGTAPSISPAVSSTSGSGSATFSTQGDYTYTLTCTGDGGSVAQDVVTVTVTYPSCPITNGTGEMIGGVCTVASCDSGYHQEGNACTSNSRSCTIENGTGVETWDGSSWGPCLPASCDSGYQISGSQCIASLPTISSFTGDRVRSGSASTLRWTLSTITDLTCTISPDPTDGSGTYTIASASGSVGTTPITQVTRYTLTCSNGEGNVSSTATVNLLPAFEEF